jgi:NADPH:quinone reductase-like Zn-dependent oxidoreductase
MKAVRIHAYGGSGELIYEDAPRPSIDKDSVLILIYAMAVNPFDCALRAGYLSSYFNLVFPFILGCDAAGVIEEVGAQVRGLVPGDRVYTRVDPAGGGGYAEYVAVRGADVVALPRSLDYIHAAALPHVALTAWQALIECAQLSAEQTVLIHGAAGGVGHIAVQLAKARGAHVIGTSSGANLAFLRELGADEVIEYPVTPFETVVRGVDVVLDTVGGDTQQRSWGALRPGGALVSLIQPPSAEIAAAHGVRSFMVASAPPVGPTLSEIAALVDGGKIRPFVSTILPLEQAARGHELIEGRHTRGKLVLHVA